MNKEGARNIGMSICTHGMQYIYIYIYIGIKIGVSKSP